MRPLGPTGSVKLELSALSTIADTSAPAAKRQAAAVELGFLASCRAEAREIVAQNAGTLLPVLAHEETPPTVLQGTIMALVQCADDDAGRERLVAAVPPLAALLDSVHIEVSGEGSQVLL